MTGEVPLPSPLLGMLASRTPLLWINESRAPIAQVRESLSVDLDDIQRAHAFLGCCAGLLASLFPELSATAGIIESPLYEATSLKNLMARDVSAAGLWLIKADHALPVAGSIKARGGIYEVLLHAERLARRAGVISEHEDLRALLSPAARSLFSRHAVAVGSTGNLGLSIGAIAAALGFRAMVHMSTDAKAWKKARLRSRGVEVMEHTGDYGEAVATGRAQAANDPSVHFVDDENSCPLLLGYSVAALRLQKQLVTAGVRVDSEHPLFVYLPCGVGGAPAGITLGLRILLGDDVHCFFAEPVASPCMLVRLASRQDRPISVREVGLDNLTEADGLAVGQASELAASLMRPLVSGVFTVRDQDLFEDLYHLERTEGHRIEPSAAAGFRGPLWVLTSQPSQEYLARHNLSARMADATHVLWTTGGALVPDEEYREFHERGKRVAHN